VRAPARASRLGSGALTGSACSGAASLISLLDRQAEASPKPLPQPALSARDVACGQALAG
jgi:hypothetical protein